MNGYPCTYRGFDGIEYLATYDPPQHRSGHWQPLSRVVISRTDGQPVEIRTCPGVKSYPAGYVAGHGDHFAADFVERLRSCPGYREVPPIAA